VLVAQVLVVRKVELEEIRSKIEGKENENKYLKEKPAMSIRSIKLPQELDLVLQMIKDSFQYPENPDWNIQQDTLDSIDESVEGMKKLWPLLKFMGIFSYQIRNNFKGFIWEEDGTPAGLATIHNQGEEEWLVGNIGVLPAYRRRGIARKLFDHCLVFFREQNCKRVYLQVIDGNTPAYSLYKDLGFEDYTGNCDMEHMGKETCQPLPLPTGYEESELDQFDWQTRYQHAKMITPEHVAKFSPIRAKDFKLDFLKRIIVPLMEKAQGLERLSYVCREKTTGEIAGRITVGLRTRPGGVCNAFIRLTPGHADLGDYLMNKILHLCAVRSPERRISLELPIWQEDAVAAAERAGFTTRVKFLEMALNLE
jgi:ribosomal protein S18 acetylase RimI-like enzyme